jgi:transcriptional regulator with XRE-family HTH domain
MIVKSIRSLRHKRGLTQSQLAEKAKISLPTIQNIEGGRGNPSLSVLEAILGVLGAKLEIEVLNNFDIVQFFNSQKSDMTQGEIFNAIENMTRIENAQLSDRARDVWVGFFVALNDHYPQLLKKHLGDKKISPALMRSSEDIDQNRLLKFRRIWLSHLSQVL